MSASSDEETYDGEDHYDASSQQWVERARSVNTRTRPHHYGHSVKRSHFPGKSNQARERKASEEFVKREVIKLYPTSARFINGLASSYEDYFPLQLDKTGVCMSAFEALH
jgi:hypothetical protein